MDSEWFLALHHFQSKRDVAVIVSIRSCDRFVGENSLEHYVAAVQMKFVVAVQEAVAGISLANWLIKAANSMFMDACD